MGLSLINAKYQVKKKKSKRTTYETSLYFLKTAILKLMNTISYQLKKQNLFIDTSVMSTSHYQEYAIRLQKGGKTGKKIVYFCKKNCPS